MCDGVCEGSSMTRLAVRKAVEADVPNLLPLMRDLAEFEKYAEDFAVNEEVLREQGFRRSPPDWLDCSFITLLPSLIARSRT